MSRRHVPASVFCLNFGGRDQVARESITFVLGGLSRDSVESRNGTVLEGNGGYDRNQVQKIPLLPRETVAQPWTVQWEPTQPTL